MKAPRFDAYRPVSAQTSEIKRRNRCTDTVHEQLLKRELRKLRVPFEENPSTIIGKPDIVLRKARVAVFCDGDFWHGKNWRTRSKKLLRGSNSDYWRAKIRANRRRDRRNAKLLRDEGWVVLRFWESDILTNPQSVALRIRAVAMLRLVV